MRHYRVLLLGDSIRLAYQPGVSELLAAEEGVSIEVVGPDESTGDSANLAEHIEAWLDEHQPDAVHFNAGLDDVRWYSSERRNHVPMGEYQMNLGRVLGVCKPRVGGDIIFATTTPVNDERQCDRPGHEFDRFNREIEEYNIAAREIMLREDVLINDLNDLVWAHDDEFLAEDGMSLTAAGIEAVASRTASVIRSLWH